MSTLKRSIVSASIVLILATFSITTHAAQKIVFANVGWTGVTIKTKTVITLLNEIGFEGEERTMSVPITYVGLSQGDVDVFLGNWMPSMKSVADKFFTDGSVIKYKANMPGAKYTLAAPTYVLDGGLKHFKDLVKYGDMLDWKIYGIEAGNDGNQIIKAMIDSDLHGMGKFKMIPSSESIMLMHVGAKVKNNEWIVFLGWAPHAMNVRYDMGYLNGSTADTFGENDGTATVYTNLRKGFTEDNPNLGLFFKNLTFPIRMMNEAMMSMHENKEIKHLEAGLRWVKQNPDLVKEWFKGVKTADGKPAYPQVETYLGSLSF